MCRQLPHVVTAGIGENVWTLYQPQSDLYRIEDRAKSEYTIRRTFYPHLTKGKFIHLKFPSILGEHKYGMAFDNTYLTSMDC